MNTMVIPGIETQGNKVRKLCMEVLGFSNHGSKNEFKEITKDIAQEVHQHLVAMNVKCLADQNRFWKLIHSMMGGFCSQVYKPCSGTYYYFITPLFFGYQLHYRTFEATQQ